MKLTFIEISVNYRSKCKIDNVQYIGPIKAKLGLLIYLVNILDEFVNLTN